MEEFLEKIFLNEKNHALKVKMAYHIISYLKEKTFANKSELKKHLKEVGYFGERVFRKVLQKLRELQIIRVTFLEKKKVYVLAPDAFYLFFKSFYEKIKK